MPTDRKPLTVKEAAERMRLSKASVYALCAAKKLSHQRVGVERGKIVITPEAIEDYLAGGQVGAAGGAAPVVVQANVKRPRNPILRHVRLKP